MEDPPKKKFVRRNKWDRVSFTRYKEREKDDAPDKDYSKAMEDALIKYWINKHATPKSDPNPVSKN